MFGILLSALNVLLGFVLRSVIVKFVMFFALFFVTSGFISYLSSSGILPSADVIGSSLGSVPSAVWYFLDLFAFSAGLPLILSAMLTRFIIRRIPLIG
ncbi:DUF2523 family protein [Rugamonas sp. CCM 8940]|uniref:DUF2523 family protein n=1 Tax=Rugamonas sp. CCM 8940 TaxID=2765359 RepID=UPI0018F79E15|nr:DUF2523 family protein [Rugamonas sp. CCM 8940]MBJ7311305.1 DUF2523 domain-containing protein [Rugamonas sp. CCM 8940]